MHSTFFVGNTFCLVGIWSDCKFNFWQGMHCKFTEYLYTFVLGCIENVLLMVWYVSFFGIVCILHFCFGRECIKQSILYFLIGAL